MLPALLKYTLNAWIFKNSFVIPKSDRKTKRGNEKRNDHQIKIEHPIRNFHTFEDIYIPAIYVLATQSTTRKPYANARGKRNSRKYSLNRRNRGKHFFFERFQFFFRLFCVLLSLHLEWNINLKLVFIIG